MRRVNRDFTNRLMGPVAGIVPPLALVHHVGRKSERSYRTPVLAFPTDKGYVTPLPYGTDTDWCLNVREAGHCTIESLGRRVAVGNPRLLGADEGVAALPALLRPGLRLASLPGDLLLDRSTAE
jgi:deazaflavin-dependent oxidoreductase (nitroreductase family)